MIEKIRHADTISIDHEDVREIEFEVDTMEVQNLGVTKVFVATLFVGSETYLLEAATHSETADLNHLDTEQSWEIEVVDIAVEE